MGKKKKIVDIQSLGERDSNASYWDHVHEHNRMIPEGDYSENLEANPDQLTDEDVNQAFPQRGPNELKAFAILEAALESLPEKLRCVWIGFYRNDYTQQEIADIVKASNQSVSVWIKQATEQVTKYCQDHADELDETGKEIIEIETLPPIKFDEGNKGGRF